MKPTIHTECSADIQAADRDTEEGLMMLNEKLALADLLRIWRNWFGNSWVTAEQVIDCLRHIDHRDLLHQVGIKSGDADELNRRLDEMRNKVIYNFVVKRDLPYMQPVKWRVLLQDNRVKITAEERNDFMAVRKEAGLKIDPATAEVDCSRGNYFDPYGIIGHKNLPLECQDDWTKLYWARSPGSDIWVEFGDLPDETSTELTKLLETRWKERQRQQAAPVRNESPRGGLTSSQVEAGQCQAASKRV
jgi:hypothetical protein